MRLSNNSHDQGATDLWRGTFSSIYGDSSGLRSNTKPKSESSNEHMPPGIGEGLPETSKRGECASKENSTSTAKPVVKRNREPAADEGTAEIWGRVDQSK